MSPLVNETVAYFSHIRRLRWGKCVRIYREHREQWRSDMPPQTVRRQQWPCHWQPLSRCTDHRACMRSWRREQLSVGRRSSARPQSCPDDVLRRGSDKCVFRQFTLQGTFLPNIRDKIANFRSFFVAKLLAWNWRNQTENKATVQCTRRPTLRARWTRLVTVPVGPIAKPTEENEAMAKR